MNHPDCFLGETKTKVESKKTAHDLISNMILKDDYPGILIKIPTYTPRDMPYFQL